MSAGVNLLGPDLIGTEYPSVSVSVERGRLRAFAHAIAETDPMYVDLDAAGAAGHPDLPVPPTFLFGLASGQGPDDFAWLADLGVDLRHVLHGEQTFTYRSLAYAGDTLVLTPRIMDVYSKRGGALQFLVRATQIRRVDDTVVADMTMTIVVRDPGATL